MYWLIGIPLCLYIGFVLSLNIPYIQRQVLHIVSAELSDYLGCDVTVGRVGLGLFNRIIIDDLSIDDRSGNDLLRLSHLSAKFDLMPLLKKRVSISTLQLFSFNLVLEKATPQSEPNFQFLLDAFASHDSVRQTPDLQLRINSLLIRRGQLAYNVISEEESPGVFNTNHIRLQDITATISLKALSKDSINATVKNLRVEEANSGFALKSLSLRMKGSNQKMSIEDFAIGLTHTALTMDTIRVNYESLGALGRLDDNVHFAYHLLPSEVYLQDIAPFVPLFNTFTEPVELEVEASGKIDNFECTKLSISSGKHFRLSGWASLNDLSKGLTNTYIDGNVDRLYADPTGVAFFLRNFSKNYTGVPSTLRNMGTISVNGGTLSGYLNEPVAFLKIETELGKVRTDLQLQSDRDQGYFAYNGSVKTDSAGFQLGAMLSNAKLGRVSLNLGVNGSHTRGRYPSVLVIGNVEVFDYSGYTYNNIVLDGSYQKGGFYGEVTLDDPNASIRLSGSLNAMSTIPEFNFLAEIEHFRPNDLLLTDEYPDTEVSVKIKADFTGGNIDEMIGQINVDSLYYTEGDISHFMDNLCLSAEMQEGGKKLLKLHCPFAEGKIEGNYSYRTSKTSVENVLRKYLPSLVTSKEQQPETMNNFDFDLTVNNTDLVADMLHLPLEIVKPAYLRGKFSEEEQKVNIECHIPFMFYNDNLYESGMLLCENVDDAIHLNARINNRKEDDTFNLAIDLQARGDSLCTAVNWGNSSQVTYSGQLSAVAHFLREQIAQEEETVVQHQRSTSRSKRRKKEEEPQIGALRTTINIHPTQVILSDTVWQIHPSEIAVDSSKVYVNNFGFSHENRHLHLHGIVSDQPCDTLHMDLSAINIGYVFDIADLGVNFRGEATGPAFACGILQEPFMRADLRIRQFGINDGKLGDLDIRAEWHNEVRGIFLDAHIQEKDVSTTTAMGYVYPLKPQSGLDLQIDANNTNLRFIHYYINHITSDFGGRATGHLNLYGKFKQLTMRGQMDADAWLKVDVLNTTYHIKDTVDIIPEGLTFKGNRVLDSRGNQGTAYGELRYDHFRDIRYNLRFDANNMLVMNTKESPDFPFYGTVYGTGSVNVSGDVNNGARFDISMTTNRNTEFTYIKNSVTTATSDQFITFNDKTPRRLVEDSTALFLHERRQRLKKAKVEESLTDIRLNLLIDATSDAIVQIVTDPSTSDRMTVRGSGNIRADYYNKTDRFNMFGTYTISQGSYKLNVQDIIRREFNIKNGSTIAFNGDPFTATLDIKTSYTVNSASLNDLMANASNYVDQTNVKVQCNMNLSGQFTSPELTFDLELPNERDEVQALVRNYIPTDEQMNMQILYLLSIGKFYTPENVTTTQNSDMMSSVLSSTLSGQLTSALSSIINNNDWNIGTNLSTGEEGWTDVEFETVLSGALLNNRLLINGNFGYRDNPVANTNFVGDFEAEWLVIRSGDIRLKAYNETNDRYYTKTNLTTQGIGVIFRKEFDKWSELMFWSRWKLFRSRRNHSVQEETADGNEKTDNDNGDDQPQP